MTKTSNNRRYLKRSSSTNNHKNLLQQFRIGIFAILLLTLLIQALPWIQTSQKQAGIEDSKAIKGKGIQGPYLGQRTRFIKGATEVRNAYFPSLEGLAEGSCSAQEYQRDWALDKRLPVEIENSINMRFRLIPPGEFQMGSPKSEIGRGPDETIHKEVIVHAFYMGIYEVRYAEWKQIMEMHPRSSTFSIYGDNRPVNEITWTQCMEFCYKLAAREGLPRGTYRLATEVEWEYACRAGTQTPFYFGTDTKRFDAFGIFVGNSGNSSHEVGSRRPNAWGLYDMHGNLWEWCFNRFYHYKGDFIDPLKRSFRGGNWYQPIMDCRSASRYRYPPDSHANLLGFRIIRHLATADKTTPFYKD